MIAWVFGFWNEKNNGCWFCFVAKMRHTDKSEGAVPFRSNARNIWIHFLWWTIKFQCISANITPSYRSNHSELYSEHQHAFYVYIRSPCCPFSSGNKSNRILYKRQLISVTSCIQQPDSASGCADEFLDSNPCEKIIMAVLCLPFCYGRIVKQENKCSCPCFFFLGVSVLAHRK